MPELTLEILAHGKSEKFTKLEVRMGRDPSCDVVFRSEEFPMVGRQHAVLLSSSGGWTVEDLHSTNGTFVNQVRVQRQQLAPGDTLRLGSDGPELRVQFLEQGFAETARMAGVMSTTVSPAPKLDAGRPSDLPPTRAAELAATASSQIAATKPNPPPESRSTASTASIASTKPSAPPPSAPMRTINVSEPEDSEPEPPAPEASSTDAAPEQQEQISQESEEEDPMNEQKLSLLRNLVIFMLGLVLVLGGIVISQMQQLSAVRDDIGRLRADSQNAVKAFEPQLDQRLNKMEANMDSLDSRMQAAQDRFIKQMDAELPKVLDKYVDKKMKEINSQLPPGVIQR